MDLFMNIVDCDPFRVNFIKLMKERQKELDNLAKNDDNKHTNRGLDMCHTNINDIDGIVTLAVQ